MLFEYSSDGKCKLILDNNKEKTLSFLFSFTVEYRYLPIRQKCLGSLGVIFT